MEVLLVVVDNNVDSSLQIAQEKPPSCMTGALRAEASVCARPLTLPSDNNLLNH